MEELVKKKKNKRKQHIIDSFNHYYNYYTKTYKDDLDKAVVKTDKLRERYEKDAKGYKPSLTQEDFKKDCYDGTISEKIDSAYKQADAYLNGGNTKSKYVAGALELTRAVRDESYLREKPLIEAAGEAASEGQVDRLAEFNLSSMFRDAKTKKFEARHYADMVVFNSDEYKQAKANIDSANKKRKFTSKIKYSSYTDDVMISAYLREFGYPDTEENRKRILRDVWD